MPGRAAAFFDYDKTLLIKDSGELGFRWAWETRHVSPFFLLSVVLANQFYKRHLISAAAMSTYCLRFYRGKDISIFRNTAREFYRERMTPYLSPSMLERVEEHRRRGDVLVIISASVDYLLEQPFNALSFDHLLCTRLETGPDGLGTGRPVGRVCVGPEKRVRAMEFAAAEGIDLAASTAYADHHSDLALLEAVGHPVAVRPTAPLRRIAQERGWEISDLR